MTENETEQSQTKVQTVQYLLGHGPWAIGHHTVIVTVVRHQRPHLTQGHSGQYWRAARSQDPIVSQCLISARAINSRCYSNNYSNNYNRWLTDACEGTPAGYPKLLDFCYFNIFALEKKILILLLIFSYLNLFSTLLVLNVISTHPINTMSSQE